MPVPTTSVTFSSIQTEFGGSNPISISEYYKGGANVPSNQTTSGTDGSAISTSGEIRIGMFRGLTETPAGGYSNFGGSLFATRLSSTLNATANVTIGTDGTISGSTSPTGGASSVSGDSWYATTAGIGNTHWMRFTVTTGQVPNLGSLTAGTWYQLSSSRTIGYSTSTSGVVSIRSGTVFVEISASAGGTVLASGTYDYYVERES